MTAADLLIPMLPVAAVLAALRAQRVTNANAARDRHQEALAEARMVVPEMVEVPGDHSSKRYALVIAVRGGHAIIDVQSQTWAASEKALVGGMLHIEQVLVPGRAAGTAPATS